MKSSRPDGGAARRSVVTGASVIALLVAGLATASASYAEPDVTDDDVRAAREAVTSTAGQVAALEVELAAQTVTLDAAWTAVAAAAETYTQALVDRDAAVGAAEDAAAREAAANEELEGARAELGTFAMQAYRSGGTMDSLGAMLSADGFEDLVARTAAVERLGDRAESAVQRFDAADLVSRTLAEKTREARVEAEESAAAAERALADAEALQADAEEKVAQVAAQRQALIAELAALRETSVEVERARQQTLEAERTARIEAAAAAERGVTPPTPPSGTTPPAGPTPPPTTPVTNPPATPPPSSGTTPPPTTAPPPPPVVTPTPTTPPPASDPYGLGTGSQRGSAAQGDSAVAWAIAQVGKPYVWGGNGPDGFDCSGLTSQAWRAAGISINRTSRDQYRQVRKITYDSMRPGDLIFYGSVGTNPGSITHVAMYVGNGQMVEAPRPGVNLRVTTIRWSGTMPHAGRP